MLRSLRSFGFAAIFALCAFASLLSSRVHAVYNALDAVPAATVLIPYFEVDLGNTSGRSTIVSVTNTSATAILVRATVWSNANLPVYSFPIYLTGYDVASFNMRDVINGVLPISATAGQDPTDTLSPHGDYSQDINFASCRGGSGLDTLPLAALSANTVNDLRAALTGVAVPNGTLRGISAGQCVGMTKGDNVARGYITMDTVNACVDATPADGAARYFADLVATRQNTLWGDYMIVDPSQNTAYGDLATMVEARPFSQSAVPGTYSFYGRFVNANDVDYREGLATHWLAQLDRDSTELQVWRDTRMVLNPSAVGFTCGSPPSPQPMAVELAGGFNFDSTTDQATVTSLFGTPIGSYPMTNAATGMTSTKKLGQFHVSLNTLIGGTADVEFTDPAATQGLVTSLRRPRGGAGFRSSAIAFPMNQVGTSAATTGLPPFNQ
jgi:hypothetical protein